ncbi:MAG TPA: MBL fold metallo-hydrolase [Puia sp.]|jgi:glyoxylase-like metal-dependent hydrolase (beta-lactamase superfamily II)
MEKAEDRLTPYICTTCGVQYPPSSVPPLSCKICEDDRQYVNPNGQTWTTLAKLNDHYKNTIEQVASNIYSIRTQPDFGIGQRAHLIVTPGGNILWDCISNIDKDTFEEINKSGGIKAIALSHPHYFSTMVEWSKSFNNAPIYVNSLDAEWLARKDAAVNLWEGHEFTLWDDIQLICCGGHFPGGSVLHNPQNGGQLLVGDVIQVCPDLKSVSFMYSYPNMIPLSKKEIRGIQSAISGKTYETIYGAFGRYITKNAMAVMDFSVDRYLRIFEE